MKSVLLSVFIFVTVLTEYLDAKRFRCDYVYNKEANGYIKYQEIPANWNEARLRCHLEGTVLASPLNPELKKLMLRMYNATSKAGVWTGIHATFSRGDFTSIEGVPLYDIPHEWMKNEPDNDKDRESCLLQLPGGTLADANCNETLPYFCFKKVVPGMAMNCCGSPDPEYTLDQRVGKCYKFHKFPRTWSRAYMACMAEGGHLAIINSEVEATVLKDIMAKYPAASYAGPDIITDPIFIGFKDWDESGEYLTIDGQTLAGAGFDKWVTGKPNNPTSHFCGAICRAGLLDNTICDKRTAFICEKDPESLMCDHEK